MMVYTIAGLFPVVADVASPYRFCRDRVAVRPGWQQRITTGRMVHTITDL
jgi:hypothetical protein